MQSLELLLVIAVIKKLLALYDIPWYYQTYTIIIMYLGNEQIVFLYILNLFLVECFVNCSHPNCFVYGFYLLLSWQLYHQTHLKQYYWHLTLLQLGEEAFLGKSREEKVSFLCMFIVSFNQIWFSLSKT